MRLAGWLLIRLCRWFDDPPDPDRLTRSRHSCSVFHMETNCTSGHRSKTYTETVVGGLVHFDWTCVECGMTKADVEAARVARAAKRTVREAKVDSRTIEDKLIDSERRAARYRRTGK